MQLSTRVQKLIPSTTLAITARVRELKLAGYDVIDLGVGEPDFNTPRHIIEAAKVAMDEGKTKYTPSSGITELKKAIQDKFERENHLTYHQNQITVTVGAKQALYNVFQVLLNPGDEVIILAPYWVSYLEQVKLAGGKPVIISCKESDDFKLTPDQLKAAISHRTKALLLNSPSNPTGMVYTKKELREIGDVCKHHDFFIISDEIYEHLVYEKERHVSIASIDDEIYSRTIIINGVSKTYAMTGWRIGYAAGPPNVIRAMTDLASHSTSNPTSIAQYAAVAALSGSSDPINEMKKAFNDRRDYVMERIQKMPKLEYKKPLGAFYLYVNIQKELEDGKYMDCDQWAEALLEQERVAVIPGSAFGSDYHIRISYATSMEQLENALDRIERFTSSHEQAQ